jgi:hypothetical protein
MGSIHQNGQNASDNTASEPYRFLAQLRPNGPWVLTAILADKSTDPQIPTTITNTASTDAEVNAFVNKYNGYRNLYYSVNPTRSATTKKAAKTDIAAIEYPLADLDPKEGESSAEAKKRYLEQLEKFEPKPTAIIDSGNGIQCLWRLTDRIPLGAPLQTTDEKGKTKWVFSPEDQARIKDIEDRIAAIMVRLGAEAGTQNIDRILRLPGTTNLPNEKKRKDGRVPCQTTMLAFNGASYALDAFPHGPGTPDDGGHHEKQEYPEDGEGAHEGSGDRLGRIIRNGPDVGEFNSKRSGAVWYVICEMLRRGYPDSVIVPTLLDRANKISAHVLEQPIPRAYAERQIRDARAKVKPADTKVEVVLPASQWLGERRVAEPPALIKGILPQTGVAMIGGQSGTGKSFLAIQLGVQLLPECRQEFYIDKYRIKRHGGILYCVLEGKPAFPMRVTAALEEVLGKGQPTLFGDKIKTKFPFSWNTYEPNLYTAGPDGLIKLAERDAEKMRQDFGVDLVAIFLDTMGLAACYENEDKAAQVQRVVSGLFKLSDATGALVIGVDHYGKDQGAGLRGSSAKRGHVETVLSCLGDRDKNGNGDDRLTNLRLKFEKIRDGEEGRIIPYRLKTVDWGLDEDGDPVTTCVVRWEPNRKQQAKPKGRASYRPPKTDVTLARAIKEVGLPADMEVLKAAFYKYHGGSNHAANTAWHRAVANEELTLVDGRLDHRI